MPRQRIFHPNFWKSGKLKKVMRSCGPSTILFYWGLVSLADDEGRGYIDFDVLSMEMPLLEIQEETVTTWLDKLNELGLIQIYSTPQLYSKKEISCYFIPDWFDKQRIDKPYTSEVPLPPKEFFYKYQDYFKKLSKQFFIINQRLIKEDRVIQNQLIINRELVDEWLEASRPMKLREVKLREVKLREKNTSCSESKKDLDSEPTILPNSFPKIETKNKTQNEITLNSQKEIIKIPLIKRDGEFLVYSNDLAQWQDTFPGINVLQELKKIRQWNLDNPDRRKTSRGIRKHITQWLSREQDKRSLPLPQNFKDQKTEKRKEILNKVLDFEEETKSDDLLIRPPPIP